MELTMIGLGKMGLNMTIRLVGGGHKVYGYSSKEATRQKASAHGVEPISKVEAVRALQSSPRIVWVMVPAGEATGQTINFLAEILSAGDIIIDGGNSNYRDTMRRAADLKRRGIHMVDVGTSGGIWGLKEGYSMMVGGEKEIVDYLTPLFKTLAPSARKGWGHVGPHGSGHFVKMVHNGIEYGMMQAYAEGFDILQAREEFGLDLHQVAEIWRHGSVVRSWLLDLSAAALKEDATLSAIEPWVEDSGEGRWTVFDAIDLDVAAPVITLALQMRFVSRDKVGFAARLLAAMRNRFGGHAIKASG